MTERRSKDPEPEPEPVVEEAPAAEVAAPGPPGQNLEFQRQPGETDAEFLARTRNQVPDSQSPSDVVPNKPNISMGLSGQTIEPEATEATAEQPGPTPFVVETPVAETPPPEEASA